MAFRGGRSAGWLQQLGSVGPGCRWRPLTVRIFLMAIDALRLYSSVLVKYPGTILIATAILPVLIPITIIHFSSLRITANPELVCLFGKHFFFFNASKFIESEIFSSFSPISNIQSFRTFSKCMGISFFDLFNF